MTGRWKRAAWIHFSIIPIQYFLIYLLLICIVFQFIYSSVSITMIYNDQYSPYYPTKVLIVTFRSLFLGGAVCAVMSGGNLLSFADLYPKSMPYSGAVCEITGADCSVFTGADCSVIVSQEIFLNVFCLFRLIDTLENDSLVIALFIVILLDNRVFAQHVNRIIEHRGNEYQDAVNLLKEK